MYKECRGRNKEAHNHRQGLYEEEETQRIVFTVKGCTRIVKGKIKQFEITLSQTSTKRMYTECGGKQEMICIDRPRSGG